MVCAMSLNPSELVLRHCSHPLPRPEEHLCSLTSLHWGDLRTLGANAWLLSLGRMKPAEDSSVQYICAIALSCWGVIFILCLFTM